MCVRVEAWIGGREAARVTERAGRGEERWWRCCSRSAPASTLRPLSLSLSLSLPPSLSDPALCDTAARPEDAA
eukprot:56132-Rhodomonas_salina.1